MKIQIVCASIPRSGSTMLYRAMLHIPPGSTTPKPQPEGIIKTHSFHPAEFEHVTVGLFLFGDPIDSVLSTRKRRWDSNHFANCGAPSLDPNTADIYGEDILNYEKMYDSWTRRQKFDLICVRYETIHEYCDIIQEFLNVDFKLPPKMLRADYRSIVDQGDLKRVEATYASLSKKIEAAPDVSIYRKKSKLK